MFSKEPSLNIIRETFYKASYDKAAYFELSELLSTSKQDNYLLQAYASSFKVLKAKHDASIFQKFGLIKTGTKELNSIITQHHSSLELRFLRYSLEWHLPQYLMLQKHQNEDKKYILTHIDQGNKLKLSTSFKESLFDFLRLCDGFNQKELNKLHKMLFSTT